MAGLNNLNTEHKEAEEVVMEGNTQTKLLVKTINKEPTNPMEMLQRTNKEPLSKLNLERT